MAVASVAGNAETSCADAYDYQKTPDGFYGVISDGAGSASRGSEGARHVVQEGMTLLRHFSDKNKETFFPKLKESLGGLAQRTRVDIHDYACTALVFRVQGSQAFFMQVGDGFVVTGSKSAYDLSLLGAKGEHVNETNFVTDAVLQVQETTVDDVDFIALGTDGLEEVAIDRRNQKLCEGFFQPFDAYLKSDNTDADVQKELENFLQSDRLKARARDDKTFLVAGYH